MSSRDLSLFPWEESGGAQGGAGQGSAPPKDPSPESVPPAQDEPEADSIAATEAAVVAQPPAVPAAAGAAPPEERAAARSEPASRRIARKEYYSISEVADLVGLPAHVLRYWESQFSVLNPSKNRSGNRVYQRKEIKLILLVKQLLHTEKYTVEGAKQRIEQLRRGGHLQQATAQALDEQMVAVLREELRTLSELLSPDVD